MYTIYQIVPGDDLITVANKYKISIEDLRKINNLPFNYTFNPGEQIIVPAINNKPMFSYLVKKGDNIYSLAKRYNVDLDTLLQINGLEKNDYIYPNEELLIPNENVETYIVGDNETLESISNKLNTDINKIVSANSSIYLLPGQLLILNR